MSDKWIKKSLLNSTTMPMGTGGAGTTGQWLMGSAARGHHHHHHEHKADGSCCGHDHDHDHHDEDEDTTNPSGGCC